MTLRKRFHQDWIHKCPDPILTCTILKCKNEFFIVFGGHDKKLYLMDTNRTILDEILFDGWCRCIYAKDIDGDGCDELLVGSGDGSCLVLKLDRDSKKLMNIKHYKAPDKINCCVAADLYGKGNINLIYGGEHNTLTIFNSLYSKVPDTILYFDSWVVSMALGFFQLPEVSQQILGLITGTKNSHVYFIAFIDNEPSILWQKNLYSTINDIKIGDVSNNGYHEIITCTNDSYVKILNSTGEKLSFIFIEESRPVSLLIEDIDGDDANEIIVGCADGSLKVYENIELNSLDFKLKWKTKLRTSIKTIYSLKMPGDERNSILFGGYDRTIRKIDDFEWGHKPKLNIPKRKFPEDVSIQKNGIQIQQYSKIPMNIREYIVKFMKQQKVISSLALLEENLKKKGYCNLEIEKEIKSLKKANALKYELPNHPLWMLEEENMISQEVPISPEESIENDYIINDNDFKVGEENGINGETGEVQTPEEISRLTDIIIKYLENKKFVNSKTDFIKDIVREGFSEVEVEQKINSMQENGLIKYSRSVPRGWSLVS